MLYGKYKRCVLFGLGSHNHHKKGFFHSHNSVKNIVKHMGKKVLVKNFSKNFNLPFVLKLFQLPAGLADSMTMRVKNCLIGCISCNTYNYKTIFSFF